MKVLFFIFLCFSLPLGAATDYTLQDLEVLAAEENDREFFAHALDIRPSERQEAWKSMAVKMADIFSRKLLEKPTLTQAEFRKVEELFAWPVLRSDDVFKLRRQELGFRYLKECLKGDSPCFSDMVSFWEKDKTNAEGAFRLAEMTMGLEGSPVSTWTFLEVALKSNLSEFFCKKDFVMEALWGKIEIDYVRLGPEGDLMKKIDLTVHPDCQPILISEARKRLYRPKTGHDRELSYQVLKSLQKMDGPTMDFFFTVYLLDNPSQGELFNYSWNRLTELGKQSLRREAVMEKMKLMDPLPDSIFSSLDQTKKKVILRHFAVNFPEYFDYYANQCVKYYGGKEKFPSGNPTIHCQDLMSSGLAPIVLDEFKIKQYQAARKI